jgi:tetrahydromethanopterin S-methyltransferase subunit H
MSSYDHDLLGVGNPHHPANQEELAVQEPESLSECLEYFRETGDSSYLEDAVEAAVRILEATRAKMVDLTHIAREVDNAVLANGISNLRNKLDL